MKHFLIIPLGGLGIRFLKDGYKTYKPFLKTSKKSRVIDNIVDNFPKKHPKGATATASAGRFCQTAPTRRVCDAAQFCRYPYPDQLARFKGPAATGAFER